VNDEAWLVCGGRDYADSATFDAAMSELIGMFGVPSKVIHGAAKGADTLADQWAKRMAVDVVACPADWKKHGRAAGPIRNAEMLELSPARVIAFPGGRGTADMVKRARAAGLQAIEIQMHEKIGVSYELW
jgi:hypothetical protein